MIHRFIISRVDKKALWGKAVVWLSLLHYYTIVSGFLAYSVIAFRKVKLSKADFIFFLGLIFLTVFHIAIKSPSEVFMDFRFYWGWSFFYLIFKSNPVSNKTLNAALIVMSVITLIEAVLINTVIGPEMLPNFPKGEQNIEQYTYAAQGYYQRPYSYSGIPTAGSTLLVVLMAICNVQGWRLLLSIGAVLSIVSGTGTFALLILLFVRYRQRLAKAAPLLVLALLVCGVVFSNQLLNIVDMFSYKIGPKYFMYLIDFKWSQILTVYDKIPVLHLFVGSPEIGEIDVVGRGGDFGFLSYIASYGVLGFLLFWLMIFTRINKFNRFPLFIVIAASIHYGVINTLPGQMILGLLLAMNKDNLAIPINKSEPDYSTLQPVKG